MVDLMTGIVGEIDKLDLKFVKDGEQVGRFWYAEETGKFYFEGNVGHSADMFVARILEQLEKIGAENERAAALRKL